MKKLMNLAALLLGLSLGFLVGIAFAQGSTYRDHVFGGMSPGVTSEEAAERMSQSSDWQRMVYGDQKPAAREAFGSYQSMGWSTFTGSWLIGHRVFDSATGTAIGQISDVVIDQRNDRIALVVLSDVPGAGGRMLAIPYGSLTRTGEHTFEFDFGGRTPVTGSAYVDQYAYTLATPPRGSEWHGISVEDIYRYYGQPPYWTEAGMHPLASQDIYRGSQLIGAEVQGFYGEGAGRVDDFVIDSSNGRIAFVGLSNVEGRGDAMVAVPFSALSRTEDQAFALDFGRDRLAAAPGFHDYAEVGNRTWAEDSYRFYGIQPYWTE
jgi:sporulation protein YlmC with PRC-barrel domain